MQKIKARYCRIATGWVVILLAVLSMFATAEVAAEPFQASPHERVEAVTADLIEAIERGREYYDTDPQRFFDEVDSIISPVIDYRFIAQTVMGKYGSKAYYKQLTSDAQRKEFVDQIKRFTAATRSRMVRTLGKGLMAFSGEKIDVLPPSAEDLQKIAEGSSVSVTQLIYRKADQPLRVQFKTRPDKSGEWKMINVVLNNINLGKQYRTEFSSKMSEYGGDTDQVIAYWAEASDDQAGDA